MSDLSRTAALARYRAAMEHIERAQHELEHRGCGQPIGKDVLHG